MYYILFGSTIFLIGGFCFLIGWCIGFSDPSKAPEINFEPWGESIYEFTERLAREQHMEDLKEMLYGGYCPPIIPYPATREPLVRCCEKKQEEYYFDLLNKMIIHYTKEIMEDAEISKPTKKKKRKKK